MPLTRPDLTKMTNDDKRALIEQIESSIVPGAADVEEKIELVGEIWDSIPDDVAFPMPDWLKEELDRRHDEYLRDPSQGITWEELEEQLRNRHANTSDQRSGTE